MAEAAQREEDPKFLCTAQVLVTAKEECLGVDAAMLTIVEDELPIAKYMKKKRWRTTAYYPSYIYLLGVEEEETTQEEDWESERRDKKSTIFRGKVLQQWCHN